ncbi:MAG: S8 family serine peptidase [Phycisphaerales bacterium]|nr:MAG: S8 family serine peptidase [Phycisphaerales bacterium]
MSGKKWRCAAPFVMVVPVGVCAYLNEPLNAAAESKQARVLPDDPYFDLQWGLHNTGQEVEGTPGLPGADVSAPEAWDVCTMPSSVTVAVIGTGVDPHPDLVGRLLEGTGTVGDLYDSLDRCDSGTRVAGIMGAERDNEMGIAGLHDTIAILPIRVSEACTTTPAEIAEGINLAVEAGVHIIVVPVTVAYTTAGLQEAVDTALDADVLVVAAAGNTGGDETRYPAGCEHVLAVSATNNQDTLADSSSFGSHIDLAAPGWEIWSTTTGEDYGYGTSTAYAAAHVTGVAALVKGCSPQLSANALAQLLFDSADDLGLSSWDDHFGHGRVNAEAALSLAEPPALRIVAVNPLPQQVPPEEVATLVVKVLEGSETLQPDSVMLAHRISPEEFTMTAMTDLGDGLFEAHLPASPCETVIEYYFSATGIERTQVTDPWNAPQAFHSTMATERQVLFTDDFEQDLGWTMEAQGAETTGEWERVEPVGTTAQPEYDRSPNAGTMCYVTGQHTGGSAGTADVDYGPVCLVSPAVSVGTLDAEVRFARWFYSSGGDDPDELTVEMSRDGGQSWTTVETIDSTDGWEFHSFKLSDFPDVIGNDLNMRFTTSDPTSDSLTEAAVDEFSVTAILCSGSGGGADGDADDNGVIDLDDYAILHSCLNGPAVPSGGGVCDVFDFNDDNHVDLMDVAAFLTVFDLAP